MEFLSWHLEVGHRWSDERRGWIPTLTVENRGPSPAHAVTATVRPALSGSGAVITHGPLELGQLEEGDRATRDLMMRAASDTSTVSVEARWRDRGGAHELSELVEPPPPPPAPRPTPMARSRLR